jgi:hypothetical protein
MFGLGSKRLRDRNSLSNLPTMRAISSESSVYQILKTYDFITSPAFVIPAAGKDTLFRCN